MPRADAARCAIKILLISPIAYDLYYIHEPLLRREVSISGKADAEDICRYRGGKRSCRKKTPCYRAARASSRCDAFAMILRAPTMRRVDGILLKKSSLYFRAYFCNRDAHWKHLSDAILRYYDNFIIEYRQCNGSRGFVGMSPNLNRYFGAWMINAIEYLMVEPILKYFTAGPP